MTMLWISCAAAAFAGLSVYNYRRFMPKPKSFGETTWPVQVSKRPITAGSHTLYGELLRPKGKEGPLPTVICCHGFGSSYQMCKKTMGMCLAKSGYGVLL